MRLRTTIEAESGIGATNGAVEHCRNSGYLFGVNRLESRNGVGLRCSGTSKAIAPMTPAQIIAVQRTFALVVPIKEKAAELFYARLFSIDSSLRSLFKGSMAEQGQKLMAALAVVVAGLADFSRVVPIVQDLGQRHAGYGVEDKDYDTVGAALLWTLEQGLGSDFTPDVREAWATAYTTLATVMKDSARETHVIA